MARKKLIYMQCLSITERMLIFALLKIGFQYGSLLTSGTSPRVTSDFIRLLHSLSGRTG